MINNIHINMIAIIVVCMINISAEKWIINILYSNFCWVLHSYNNMFWQRAAMENYNTVISSIHHRHIMVYVHTVYLHIGSILGWNLQIWFKTSIFYFNYNYSTVDVTARIAGNCSVQSTFYIILCMCEWIFNFVPLYT